MGNVLSVAENLKVKFNKMMEIFKKNCGKHFAVLSARDSGQVIKLKNWEVIR